MKALSLSQRAEIRDKVLPILGPYFLHQGWPSLADADAATSAIIAVLREAGVRL